MNKQFMSNTIIEQDIDFSCLMDDTTNPMLINLGYPALPIQCIKDETYRNTVPIGKRLHFIWVGRLIPDKYNQTVIQSKKINSTYEVILWVDDTSMSKQIRTELEQNGIIVKNIYRDELQIKPTELKQEMLYLLNKNPNGGYQADIIRLYVVYMYGGIYSDIDSVWLKPLDDDFTYEFVTYRIDKHCSNFTNSFFGFAKGSYILKNLLNNLKHTIGFFERLNNQALFVKYIPGITGPSYLTWLIKIMKPEYLNYIHQAYCVIGGPHEELYSNYSKEGKAYCYQTFDKNWCS
jgi:mannosyltransferase OCH1-like enzyme